MLIRQLHSRLASLEEDNARLRLAAEQGASGRAAMAQAVAALARSVAEEGFALGLTTEEEEAANAYQFSAEFWEDIQ